MNGPIPLFIALIAFYLFVGLKKPKYMFFVWPIILLVLPTTRTKLGPVPVYWFDIATFFLIVWLFSGSKLKRYWPKRMPRWHWWFIGVALLFGTIFPIIRYGFNKEILWIFGHAGLAWMAFPIGIALYVMPRSEDLRKYLIYGLFVSLVLSAAVAVYQYGSPARAGAINQLYFGDIEGSIKLAEFSAEYNASRVNGPHGGPNGFGGTTAIAAAVMLLLAAFGFRKLVYISIFLALIVVAATVSRQVLVAVSAGLMVAFFFTRLKGKMRIASIVSIALIGVLATGVADKWGERLGKWEGGVDEDRNVMGRLVIGPERLFSVISRDVTVLIGGVGLDVQKLVKKAEGAAHDVGFYQMGFVSNSFLLPLYYLGICGFLLTLIFWYWVVMKALRLPRTSRAIGMGCVVMTMLLIAADNYAFLKEPSVVMIFLLAAVIAGKWHEGRQVATGAADANRLSQ